MRLKPPKTWLAIVLLLAATSGIENCGASRNRLDHLAALGSIDEQAPVVALSQIEIAAPPGNVWKLLTNASAWPAWQKNIGAVTVSGPMGQGASFTWKTGGLTIHSQVQLFDPPRRLAWTGTALTAQAIHVWELSPAPADHTLVRVKESMDGPFMALLYPSAKLAEDIRQWLAALKVAAEQDTHDPARF